MNYLVSSYLPTPKLYFYHFLIRIFRLAASVTETRSESPCAEINDQNKRPAVICDFYAKGWCIKGSSCRFLHIRDHLNNDPQRKGDGAADYKVEVQLEGISCVF